MAADANSPLNEVLSQYAVAPVESVTPLGNAGGFSGAQIWRVTCQDQQLCLRRWPKSHPDAQQLDWMHRVLSHVAIQDCPFVPVPFRNRKLQPFTIAAGCRFELAPWMPGKPTYADQPTAEKLTNAVEALAKFHLGSAQVSLNFAVSKNIQSRLRKLAAAPQQIKRIADAGSVAHVTDAASISSGFASTVGQLKMLIVGNGMAKAKRLQQQLEPFANQMWPVQPIIRDVWHDHILFTGDQVTGVVDYGAMQMDHITLDLSRMLGSLVGDQSEDWNVALERYSHYRPIPEPERELVRILDRATVLLGSLNWLDWLLIERRQFESGQHVQRRVKHLVERFTACFG